MTARGESVCRPPGRFAPGPGCPLCGGRSPSGPPHPFQVLSQWSLLSGSAPTVRRMRDGSSKPHCLCSKVPASPGLLPSHCLLPSLDHGTRGCGALVRSRVPRRRLPELRDTQSRPTRPAPSWGQPSPLLVTAFPDTFPRCSVPLPAPGPASAYTPLAALCSACPQPP